MLPMPVRDDTRSHVLAFITAAAVVSLGSYLGYFLGARWLAVIWDPDAKDEPIEGGIWSERCLQPRETLHRIQRRGPVRSRIDVRRRTRQHFIWVLVPPNAGSTAIFKLLSSSPLVTTLCKGTKWQCEGTSTPLLRDTPLWSYNLTSTASWDGVLDHFYRLWDAAAPIKLDKSPPFLCYCESFVQYLCARNLSSTFLFFENAGGANYCYHTGLGSGMQLGKGCGGFYSVYEHCARQCQEYAKRSCIRTVYSSFDRLVRDPYAESEALLRHIPELVHLDPSYCLNTSTRRGKSLLDYREKHPVLKPRRKRHCYDPLQFDRVWARRHVPRVHRGKRSPSDPRSD